MHEKMEQTASIYLIDQHIHELEQRLSALQEIIINLLSDDRNVEKQAELLLKMLETRSALKAFRQELRKDLGMRRSSTSYNGASVSEAWQP